MIKVLTAFLKRTLAGLGLQITRIHEPLPAINPINVFELCAHELSQKLTEVSVIQVGANDGVRADPIRSMISTLSWKGLLIEPHPKTFEILLHNYRNFPGLRFLNAAVSDTDGCITLFAPSEALSNQQPRLSGLCSLDKEVLKSTMQHLAVPNSDSNVVEIKVRSVSVKALLREHMIDKVDVLQIDTEGYDWKVLAQFDLDELGVQLINIEFFHLPLKQKIECLRHLNGLGFKMALVLGDLVAYRRELSASEIRK